MQLACSLRRTAPRSGVASIVLIVKNGHIESTSWQLDRVNWMSSRTVDVAFLEIWPHEFLALPLGRIPKKVERPKRARLGHHIHWFLSALRSGVLFATCLPALAACAARFFRGELVRSAFFVRCFSTLAGNSSLLLRIHSSESSFASSSWRRLSGGFVKLHSTTSFVETSCGGGRRSTCSGCTLRRLAKNGSATGFSSFKPINTQVCRFPSMSFRQK